MKLSLKENAIVTSIDYTGSNFIENYYGTKFVKMFTEDYKIWGKRTKDLYISLFGESVKNVVEHLSSNSQYLQEAEKLNCMLLFEGYSDRKDLILNEIVTDIGDVGLSKVLDPYYSHSNATPKVNQSSAQDYYHTDIGKAEQQKIVNSIVKSPVPASTPGKSAVGIPAKSPAKPPVKSPGFIAWLTTLWNGIKGMGKDVWSWFKGDTGVSGIGKAIQAGNWNALATIPLVQAGLATGGVVVAWKLLKRLFGNRAEKNKDKIMASLQQRQAAATA